MPTSAQRRVGRLIEENIEGICDLEEIVIRSTDPLVRHKMIHLADHLRVLNGYLSEEEISEREAVRDNLRQLRQGQGGSARAV